MASPLPPSSPGSLSHEFRPSPGESGVFPRRQAPCWELPAFLTSGEWFAGFSLSDRERGSASRQKGWHRGQPSGPERRLARCRKPGLLLCVPGTCRPLPAWSVCVCCLLPGTLFPCPGQDWPLLILWFELDRPSAEGSPLPVPGGCPPAFLPLLFSPFSASLSYEIIVL